MKQLVNIFFIGLLLFLYGTSFAQVDLDDQNWELIFDEEFTGRGRIWNSAFLERELIPSKDDYYSLKWACCMKGNYPSEVMTGPKERHRHVYQRTNAKFGSGLMRLIAEFKGIETLLCDDFETPTSSNCYNNLLRPCFYYSGMIETVEKLGFGYYETRCAVPVHSGSCASFWFFGCSTDRYGEIDIMEYFQGKDELYISPYKYTTGIWYNPNASNYVLDTATGYKAHYVGDGTVEWSSPEAPISSYHTYACEWMPDRVTWFFDGEVVNEYREYDSIPKHTMRLRMTHPIDRRGCDTVNGVVVPIWTGIDTLTVDYVKAYRLKCNCDTDVSIQTTAQFAAFEPSVKHSITIGNTYDFISATVNTDIVMRATDSIAITAGFEIPLGGKLTLMTQECPDW